MLKHTVITIVKTRNSLRYRIFPAIRRGFRPSRMTSNNLISPMNFAIIPTLPFLNNAKVLDPSYKTDLELLDCFGRKKNPVL